MKKVAIFTISLRGGGAERIVSYLLNEGYKDFEFHLILLDNTVEYDIPTPHVKVVQLEKKGTSGYLSVFRTRSLAKKLHDYIREHEIDTLFSLLNRPNLISCLVRNLGWNGKIIISERIDTIAYYRSRRFGSLMLRMVEKYYPVADKIIVISKGIANSLQQLGIKGCDVIYNPVYLSNEQQPRPMVNDNDFTFINVARFEEQKNHRLLLQAFAKLPGKNSRLLLLGKGKLQRQLEGLARKLGVQDRVEFLGFQKNIDEWLLRSDCFVFSSDFEGLGNAIIESLKNGVPVVSTDCPHGPREILDPETTGKELKDEIDLGKYGILVPVKRPDLLAMAMDRMYSDQELRETYSRLSLERVKDFEVTKISKEYFDLF